MNVFLKRTKAKQMSVLAGEKAERKRMLPNPGEKERIRKKIVESVLLNMHNFCRKKKDRKKSGKSYPQKLSTGGCPENVIK